MCKAEGEGVIGGKNHGEQESRVGSGYGRLGSRGIEEVEV